CDDRVKYRRGTTGSASFGTNGTQVWAVDNRRLPVLGNDSPGVDSIATGRAGSQNKRDTHSGVGIKFRLEVSSQCMYVRIKGAGETSMSRLCSQHHLFSEITSPIFVIITVYRLRVLIKCLKVVTFPTISFN